jgi:BON domain-containing protein
MAGQWFYRMFGEEFGPVPFETLKELTELGTISATDEIREASAVSWVKANEVKALGLNAVHNTADTTIADAPISDFDLKTTNASLDGWYRRLGDQEFGPFNFHELVEDAKREHLSADDDVKLGMNGKWRRVGSIGRLMAALPYQPSEKRITPDSRKKSDANQRVVGGIPSDVVDSTTQALTPQTNRAQLEAAYQAAYNQAKTQFTQSMLEAAEATFRLAEEQAQAQIAWAFTPQVDRFWWGWMGGVEFGPVEFMQVFALAKNGQLNPIDFVRNGQIGQYLPSANITGLFSAVSILARATEALQLAKTQAESAAALVAAPPKFVFPAITAPAAGVAQPAASTKTPDLTSSQAPSVSELPPRFAAQAKSTAASVAESAQATSRSPRMSAVDDTSSDDEVLRRVADSLAEHQVASFARIGLDVKRGVITVRGDVASQGERLLLLRVLQNTPGVMQVNDGLSLAQQPMPRTYQTPRRAPSKSSSFSFPDLTDWIPNVRVVGGVFGVLIVGLLGYWYSTLGPSRPVAVHPVKGRAVFEGQPMSGANVILHPRSDSKVPAELRPRGSVAADGTFVLSTFDSNDGAPSGDFVVTVVWSKPVVINGETQFGPNLAPMSYSKPESSPLRIKIAPGTKELEPLELKKDKS